MTCTTTTEGCPACAGRRRSGPRTAGVALLALLAPWAVLYLVMVLVAALT